MANLFFFQIFYFLHFFEFSENLALNAQVNPNIKKCQLSGNGAKNLLGRIQVLKFIAPSIRFYR